MRSYTGSPFADDNGFAIIVIEVARLRKAALTEIVPAWAEFVGEALPIGSSARAGEAAAFGGVRQRLGTYVQSGDAAYLRNLANGTRKRPEPQTVWQLAGVGRCIHFEGGQAPDPFSWCAGPLFLFAASYFERFAAVMLDVDLGPNGAIRKRHLLDDVISACVTTIPESWGAIRDELLSRGVSETILRRELRRLQSHDHSPAIRPERNTWILTAKEIIAFDSAFAFPKMAERAPVVNAHLVDLHPEIGLKTQREIVVAALRDAI